MLKEKGLSLSNFLVVIFVVGMMILSFLPDKGITPERPLIVEDGVIGVWYDDLGSPDYMDATFTIYKTNNRLFIHSSNGDESKGTYQLNLSEGKYIKVNSKFGTYYTITNKGLNIYNKIGYIRTAKKLK